jgi:transcriptional regulator PpsR
VNRAAPRKPLVGELDGRDASRLVKAASDVALVLDGAGTIVDLAVQDAEIPAATTQAWLGQPWIQTVTIESRQKVEAMLRDALAAAGETRWRQVNHPGPEGVDLPLLYATVRIPDARGSAKSSGGPRIVAFGRSLRATVALQQRLVEAQQAMERDYWRFREAETRYRHLFQTSSEAVLIVDGLSQKVLEANPAARALCGEGRGKLIGVPLSTLFDAAATESLQSMLAAARSIGRKDSMRAHLLDQRTEVTIAASVFRQDDNTLVLVRVVPLAPVPGERPGQRPGQARPGSGLSPSAGGADALLQAFVHNAADALVFTDVHGRVLSVNRAFVALAQLGAEGEVRGQMLDRWVGRTGIELGVLIANLRQRGSTGLFLTQLRSEYGGTTDVEIAASMVQQGDETVLAFAIRNIERRLRSEQAASKPVTRTVGDLADLVGNVPLKEIVSETTDLIEQLCIETALQMTGDKRASAALLLGLSRQSLYVKLRRFGIAADQGADDDA